MPGQSQNSGQNAIFGAIDLAGQLAGNKLKSEADAVHSIVWVRRLREILPDAANGIADASGKLPKELAEWAKGVRAVLRQLEFTMPVVAESVDVGDFDGDGLVWVAGARPLLESLAVPAAVLKWRRAEPPFSTLPPMAARILEIIGGRQSTPLAEVLRELWDLRRIDKAARNRLQRHLRAIRDKTDYAVNIRGDCLLLDDPALAKSDEKVTPTVTRFPL